ncbi:MAG: ABC transporter permease [Beutenbergiaceae bacterium]
MRRLTLSQMRVSAGRLGAAAIAIVLGTSFVAAALLASGAMELGTREAFTAGYGRAELVLETWDADLTAADLDAVRQLPGVAAADPYDFVEMEVSGAVGESVALGVAASDMRLLTMSLHEGRMGSTPYDLVLASDVAQRIGAEIGDAVSVVDGADEADCVGPGDLFTVVGLLEPPTSPFANSFGGLIDANIMEACLTEVGPGAGGGIYREFRIVTNGDVEAVREQLLSQFGGRDVAVSTVQEIAEKWVRQTSGSDVSFLLFSLAFAAVSLVVAGLVIANTFAVLVAQRTVTLALLRCVGASRAQVRRSVLTEALVLAVIASTVGLAFGTAVTMIGARLLATMVPEAGISGSVPFSPWVPPITLAVGIGVTVIAALVPARMATRVAPIVALRPVEGATVERAGRPRVVLALAGIAGGAACLIGGVVISRFSAQVPNSSAGAVADDEMLLAALVVGVLGGVITLAGVLLGSVLVVPWMVARLGVLVRRGVAGRLATVNAARNPRRSAATVNALVIGVALVVTMSVGAATARESLFSRLDERYPIDLVVTTANLEAAIDPAQMSALQGVDGVALTVSAQNMGWVELYDGQDDAYVETLAVDEGALAQVIRSADGVPPMAADTIVTSAASTDSFDNGDQVTLLADLNVGVDLTIAHGDTGGLAFVSPGITSATTSAAPGNALLIRLEPDADEVAVAKAIQRLATELAERAQYPTLEVNGLGVMRQGYSEVINLLLTVVLGLLGVAVVVALVGVANTLSLSVIERRRESAMLRAIGLTRRQLRSMLAIEGVLMAVMGALIGVVAGLAFGWAGSAILLGSAAPIRLGFPVLHVVLVFVVAVVAGVLASVLPARAAVRQSPVAALAAD